MINEKKEWYVLEMYKLCRYGYEILRTSETDDTRVGRCAISLMSLVTLISRRVRDIWIHVLVGTIGK